MKCPKALNETIKTEIVTKADRENSSAILGRWAFRDGAIMLALIILISCVTGAFFNPAFTPDVMVLVFMLPVILLGVGAYSCHQHKFNRDHKFHAIADRIRQERSNQHSLCARKIEEHYSATLQN